METTACRRTFRDIFGVCPDVYHVTALKRGFFNFQGADVRMVMRQIACWYDVVVEFALKNVPVGEYSVEIRSVGHEIFPTRRG